METEAEYLQGIADYNERENSPARIAEREADLIAAAASLGLTVEEFGRRVNANFKPWIK